MLNTQISRPTTVILGGLPTVAATREELATLMTRDCLAARGSNVSPKLVFSSNGQGLALTGTSADFAEAMASADIIHADGMAAVLFSRLLSPLRLPERVATTDFFHNAAREAEASGLKFYFLGASLAQNQRAIEQIRRRYPRLAIVGRRDGYFGEDQDAEVCAEIVASGADVLWVGLGKPKQEFWAVANRDRLRGVGWLKTCGGLYAFLAEDSPRAPQWMQSMALEWLWRMLKEPRRLGPRYLLTNPYALWLLLTRSELRWSNPAAAVKK